MENKKSDQITFEYKKSSNFLTHAVSGIHRGLTAHGEVNVNFFYERTAIPEKVTHKIKGEQYTEVIKKEKSDSIIRDVMFGITLNPNLARSIAKWLNDKCDEFEKILKSQHNKK